MFVQWKVWRYRQTEIGKNEVSNLEDGVVRRHGINGALHTFDLRERNTGSLLRRVHHDAGAIGTHPLQHGLLLRHDLTLAASGDENGGQSTDKRLGHHTGPGLADKQVGDLHEKWNVRAVRGDVQRQIRTLAPPPGEAIKEVAVVGAHGDDVDGLWGGS